ncbi:hypothetical protein HG535_0D02690 [Zygotorulaspora mrakii]|uniref:lysine--tRNA ligase n=1 Tax=Zygotorulaspora mrakii TaxID=42260 RepID=A0A7H9B1P7_ZYGMR|nr:uncharacterized protein HG535_0D02690 [Zygotorulaspora mrakii]QLG72561.1 hypothetical protein HG535_0D02690 [Zygotorulaspora mrakii]
MLAYRGSMSALRSGACRRALARLYSSGSRKQLSIDAGTLEFSKRNGILEGKLKQYYPSLSNIRVDPLYKPTTLEKFRADYVVAQEGPVDDESNQFYVNGRVKSIRFSGKKICFIDVYSNQSGAQLQLIINFQRIDRKEQCEFVGSLEFLKVGDFIQAYGFPSYSKSRARTMSLNCTKLPVLLSAAQLSLPPKLSDAAKIKNNRVVDYQVNGVEVLLLRHSILKSLRDFFDSRGFVEVETPILSSKSNGAAAQPFKTTSHSLPKNANELEMRVAPELWLKRLVVSGLDKVYEIGKVFRNEGVDAIHNAEFTTLEFYQSFTSMEQLIEISEELFKKVLLDLTKSHDNDVLGKLNSVLRENNWKFKRVEFLPTLTKELGVDFSKVNLENADEIYGVLPRDAEIPKNLSSQQLLNKLCAKYIEPLHCNALLPTVIYHHPTVMSPLAKTNPLNPDTTKRFEIFINGQEYINAYEEENCPQLQLAKFEAQQKAGETYNDKESLNVDYNYVEAMKWGMPPIGGFGLGIDRLCMLLLNKKRLEEVIAFGCLDDVNRQ